MSARVVDDAVGITTTVPVEAIFAAGRVPVDLNNVFITGGAPEADMALAEASGFPSTCCAWVKGVYGAARRTGVSTVVGVVEGDCSETGALLEILEREGVEVVPFAFPRERTREAVAAAVADLCDRLGTTPEAAEAQKTRLDAARLPVRELDRLAWEEGRTTGPELFDAQVNASDFRGDPEAYRLDMDARVEAARTRPPRARDFRIGLLGVPPVMHDLVEVVESLGAGVAYVETPRQFSLPYPECSLAEAYRRYAYPYDLQARLDDITEQATLRRLDGLVHYVQTFCHRQLHDRVIRAETDLPVLTVEGDRPGPVDSRTLTRIEAFFETMEQHA